MDEFDDDITHEIILTAAEWKRLLEIIHRPPAPTQALVDLFAEADDE